MRSPEPETELCFTPENCDGSHAIADGVFGGKLLAIFPCRLTAFKKFQRNFQNFHI